MQTEIWPADISSLSAIQEFVEQICGRAGFSVEQTIQINIAIEELVVNIISHGFEDPSGEVIEMEVDDEADKLTLRLIDSGMPFDPITAKEADTAASLEDRPIGGLGLTLVKNFTDQVDYKNENNQNILSLTILKKQN